MKNKAIVILITLLFFSPMFAKKKSLPEMTQTISLTQIEDALLNDVLNGKRPDIAIECGSGTTIPVQFFQNTGIFGIELFPNLTINVQKTCYLRFFEKKGYISLDSVEWDLAERFLSGTTPKVQVKFNRDNGALVVESELVPEPEDEDDEDEDDDDDDWDEYDEYPGWVKE